MAKAVVVALEELRDGRYAKAICYPRPDPDELNARLNELQQLGVKALQFTGSTQIDGTHVTGKGTVGVIITGLTADGPVAVKIRRTDARRADMSHESEMLAKANSVDVGPRLYGVTKNAISMQLIRGLPLARWLETKKRRKTQVHKILHELLSQAYRLDQMRLDHGELSRAPKNVVIGPGIRSWILDFESASMNRKPKNVTSVIQYFMFGNISHNISWSRMKREAVLNAVRAYKKRPNAESFRAITKALRSRGRG